MPGRGSVLAHTEAELRALSCFHDKVNAIDLDAAPELFDIIDADDDGRITQAELREALQDERVTQFMRSCKVRPSLFRRLARAYSPRVRRRTRL